MLKFKASTIKGQNYLFSVDFRSQSLSDSLKELKELETVNQETKQLLEDFNNGLKEVNNGTKLLKGLNKDQLTSKKLSFLKTIKGSQLSKMMIHEYLTADKKDKEALTTKKAIIYKLILTDGEVDGLKTISLDYTVSNKTLTSDINESVPKNIKRYIVDTTGEVKMDGYETIKKSFSLDESVIFPIFETNKKLYEGLLNAIIDYKELRVEKSNLSLQEHMGIHQEKIENSLNTVIQSVEELKRQFGIYEKNNNL